MLKLILFFASVITVNALPERFLHALAMVESSNNPRAYNVKEGAVGIYQIRADYFLDAQKANSELKKYKHSDCYNPEIAKKVVIAYMSRYCKNNNLEEMARAHNGGCGWKTKRGQAKKNLDRYWAKVLTNMKKYNHE